MFPYFIGLISVNFLLKLPPKTQFSYKTSRKIIKYYPYKRRVIYKKALHISFLSHIFSSLQQNMLFYEKGEANYISKFCEGYEYLVAYENTKYELWFMDLFFSSFDLRQSDSITSLELTQHHPHPPKTTKRWVIDWLPFSLFYMCEIKTTPFSPFWLFIRKLFLILLKLV